MWLEAASVECDQLVDPTDMLGRLWRELAVLAVVPRVSLILAVGMLSWVLHWSYREIRGQLTPQLGHLWLPHVIICRTTHSWMLLSQARGLVGVVALARVFVTGSDRPSGPGSCLWPPLIRINLFHVLPWDLWMVLSCLSAWLSGNFDSVRGSLRDFLWLLDLGGGGILGTQRRGSRLLLSLWSPAGLVLALVLEVLQQLALGQHRMIRAYALVFEADVWVVNGPSRAILIDYHRHFSGLVEDLGEADYLSVVVVPVGFVLLGLLLRRLLGGDRRLASLPHVLLHVPVQVVEVLLDFVVFVDFDRELEASLDLLLPLLALDELVNLRRRARRLLLDLLLLQLADALAVREVQLVSHTRNRNVI